MRAFILTSALLGLLLCAAPLFASDEKPAYPQNEDVEFYTQTEKPRPFTVSPAAGYGLLYKSDDKSEHHGFYSRIMFGYSITPQWSIHASFNFGGYDGDVARYEGFFSQVGLSAQARYTFLDDWIRPYVQLGLGWVRTEHDLETETMFVEHSLALEPGVGLIFRLVPNYFLGVETVAVPQFFGDHMKASVNFRALANFEYRF